MFMFNVVKIFIVNIILSIRNYFIYFSLLIIENALISLILFVLIIVESCYIEKDIN